MKPDQFDLGAVREHKTAHATTPEIEQQYQARRQELEQKYQTRERQLKEACRQVERKHRRTLQALEQQTREQHALLRKQRALLQGQRDELERLEKAAEQLTTQGPLNAFRAVEDELTRLYGVVAVGLAQIHNDVVHHVGHNRNARRYEEACRAYEEARRNSWARYER